MPESLSANAVRPVSKKGRLMSRVEQGLALASNSRETPLPVIACSRAKRGVSTASGTGVQYVAVPVADLSTVCSCLCADVCVQLYNRLVP